MSQQAAVAGPAAYGNEIPPSTIAAQIVNNHSRANDQQEPQNNALYGMLLQEFLTDPSAGEKGVELNLQLISVVVEAGLNALLKEREPLGQDVLLSQARDSISVIRISLERNPNLLFYQDASAENPIFHLPLVAWLIPKLFSLLTCPSLEALQGDLNTLLASMLCALSRPFKDSDDSLKDLWPESVLLLEFYQATIDGSLLPGLLLIAAANIVRSCHRRDGRVDAKYSIESQSKNADPTTTEKYSAPSSK